MPAGVHVQSRVLITVPPDWVPEIDAKAARLGVTRTEYLRRLILADQPKRTQGRLSRPQVARPKGSG